MCFHSHQAPDCRSQESYMPLLLRFPEFGPQCASAEVHTTLSLTPLKLSACIGASSAQVLQTCNLTIPVHGVFMEDLEPPGIHWSHRSCDCSLAQCIGVDFAAPIESLKMWKSTTPQIIRLSS